MAKLLYMICSQSGTVDRYSNCVSAFTIIEVVHSFPDQQISAIPAEQHSAAMPKPEFSARMVATWIGDESDQGTEFEYETTLLLKENADLKKTSSGSFVWKNPSHRLIVDIFLPTLAEADFIRLGCGIRPNVEGGEWIRHEYEIKVESHCFAADTAT